MGGLFSKKDDDGEHEPSENRGLKKSNASFMNAPYVLKRISSMFFDEDGDLAHEFFIECEARCEVTYSRVRWSMKKIQNGLKPQGEVGLRIPRLNVDLPCVLIENNQNNIT